ncbi:MAG TPA: VWA domain-containing protein [Thermoanaerobaculia bacterium]|nr:VWA domain-containing protein [Thermoanaerobaculia bacterium]
MSRSSRSSVRTLLQAAFLSLILTAPAGAATQLLLTRGETPEKGEYLGVVELTVDPGFEAARVWITVNGQKIAEGLRWPHRVMVDFGPTAIEHKISVTAIGPNKRRVQWHETLNRGQLPLSVKLQPVDLAARVFEAKTTAPKSDPVVAVELWHQAEKVVNLTRPPFRFEVPEEVLASGFVQVTARSKSGSEAADFWSRAGDIHVESIQVRTVPIFVSVVDRNGMTHAEVDRALFRIMDNDAEGTIVEFGNAFDQPISIALLIDGSASMTYAIGVARKAALEFVNRILKPGDRCSVTAVQEVPRRRQGLTSDTAAVAGALDSVEPSGSTALYDAIAAAIRELKDEKNRRAIVVLTDGGDTDSIRSYGEIEKSVAESGIPLYFIAYDTGQQTQLRDLERLRHLAAYTGGFVAVATNQNLQAKYGEIERDLRAQFAILYQVTDFVRPKEWRRVRVTLASPRLTARTIRGYFTP